MLDAGHPDECVGVCCMHVAGMDESSVMHLDAPSTSAGLVVPSSLHLHFRRRQHLGLRNPPNPARRPSLSLSCYSSKTFKAHTSTYQHAPFRGATGQHRATEWHDGTWLSSNKPPAALLRLPTTTAITGRDVLSGQLPRRRIKRASSTPSPPTQLRDALPDGHIAPRLGLHPRHHRHPFPAQPPAPIACPLSGTNSSIPFWDFCCCRPASGPTHCSHPLSLPAHPAPPLT